MIDPEAELTGPLKRFTERSLVLLRGQICGRSGFGSVQGLGLRGFRLYLDKVCRELDR